MISMVLINNNNIFEWRVDKEGEKGVGISSVFLKTTKRNEEMYPILKTKNHP